MIENPNQAPFETASAVLTAVETAIRLVPVYQPDENDPAWPSQTGQAD